jgi:hypothetical protein
MPHTTEDVELVLFELLPGAAADSKPPTGQVVLNLRTRYLNPCRQAFEDSHESRAMRFTSS